MLLLSLFSYSSLSFFDNDNNPSRKIYKKVLTLLLLNYSLIISAILITNITTVKDQKNKYIRKKEKRVVDKKTIESMNAFKREKKEKAPAFVIY